MISEVMFRRVHVETNKDVFVLSQTLFLKRWCFSILTDLFISFCHEQPRDICTCKHRREQH